MGDEMPPGQISTSAGVAERMQTLLSRAVEEQVAEQQAVSAVLTEVRGQVEVLSEAVRRVASHDAVEQVVRSVAGVVIDIRTATSLLGQRLDLLTARLDALGARTLSSDVDPQLDPRQRGVGSVPAPEQLRDAVVEALAPRLDVLAEQVADALLPRLQTAVAAAVEVANHASERRVTAHVDESVFALAEALLRRQRGPRGAPVPMARDRSAEVAAEVPAAQDGGQVEPATDEEGHAMTSDVAGDTQTFSASKSTEPDAEAEPDAEPEPDAKPKPELEPDVGPEPDAEPEPEPDAEPDVEPGPEVKSEPEPEVKPEPEPEPEAEPEPAAEPEPEPYAEPEPEPVRPLVTTSLAPSATRSPASTRQGTVAEAAPEPADDDEHRRRPWWRPGSPPPSG